MSRVITQVLVNFQFSIIIIENEDRIRLLRHAREHLLEAFLLEHHAGIKESHESTVVAAYQIRELLNLCGVGIEILSIDIHAVCSPVFLVCKRHDKVSAVVGCHKVEEPFRLHIAALGIFFLRIHKHLVIAFHLVRNDDIRSHTAGHGNRVIADCVEPVIILYTHKTYHTRTDMTEIGIVYAYMRKLRIIIHKLLHEPSVGISLPHATAAIPVHIFYRIGKEETAVRQHHKIRDKVINIYLPMETAVQAINEYLVAVPVHDKQLVSVRKYIKALNNTVIAKAITLTVKTFNEMALPVKEEQCACRTDYDGVSYEFDLINSLNVTLRTYVLQIYGIN